MSKPRQFAFNTELGRSCATVGRDVISGLPCANVTSHGEVCVCVCLSLSESGKTGVVFSGHIASVKTVLFVLLERTFP
jgi:hypothetical protein